MVCLCFTTTTTIKPIIIIIIIAIKIIATTMSYNLLNMPIDNDCNYIYSFQNTQTHKHFMKHILRT